MYTVLDRYDAVDYLFLFITEQEADCKKSLMYRNKNRILGHHRD